MPTREERAVDDRELMRALIIEFIGPFALVFMGVGAVILTQGQDVVAIAKLADGSFVRTAANVKVTPAGNC